MLCIFPNKGGNSTLRLLRYPVRPPASFEGADPDEVWTEYAGRRREVQGRAHVDSGFMTLLAQDGVGGLQAQFADGVERSDDHAAWALHRANQAHAREIKDRHVGLGIYAVDVPSTCRPLTVFRTSQVLLFELTSHPLSLC